MLMVRRMLMVGAGLCREAIRVAVVLMHVGLQEDGKLVKGFRRRHVDFNGHGGTGQFITPLVASSGAARSCCPSMSKMAFTLLLTIPTMFSS